jgi:repressor LexA
VETLTVKQRTILDFVLKYTRDKGVPPSQRLIADGVGLKSHRTVAFHLKAIEKKGAVRLVRCTARGVVCP